ncbi:alpha/beta fold hydrolase [Streptomyces collinus]|uniref:alpha/beta fold hydrolase n=1 Tax=Streptomyces collinus TaxID=42684 RepID=UPI00339EC6E2
MRELSIPTVAGVFDAWVAGPPEGRPVLLLHGSPQTGLVWRRQIAAPAAHGYRVVTPDQRGYSPGARPPRPADYRMDLLVDDVVAIMEELGWPAFELIGHDWGDAVAWWAADAHPDRVRTLSVVSTPHPGAQELRTLYAGKVPRDSAEAYLRHLSRPGAPTAALNWYRAGRADHATGVVGAPTLYVWSTEDSAFGAAAPQETGRWVHAPYRFETLQGVSHWVPEEAPDALSRLLLDHLRTHGMYRTATDTPTADSPKR